MGSISREADKELAGEQPLSVIQQNGFLSESASYGVILKCPSAVDASKICDHALDHRLLFGVQICYIDGKSRVVAQQVISWNLEKIRQFDQQINGRHNVAIFPVRNTLLGHPQTIA